MRKIIQKICFGNESKINVLFVLGIFIAFGLGCSNLIPKDDKVDTVKTPEIDNKSSETKERPSTQKTVTKKADASKGEIPADDELQEMVKTTLLDFNDAIQSADFTTFYGNISKLWQRQTSPAKLEDTFKVFIDGNNNFSSIRSKEAEFSSDPQIEKDKGFKELVLEGKYDTSPLPTKFTLKYTPEGKNWKLTGIIVDTTP
ncbi:MAG: hypothetical protein M3R14_00520 [Acidobacteriota bacterium]|nr:hypothetical protein [Acidobacteriota bacterium]